MKLTTGLTLLAISLASSNTFAAVITNGDFSSCDYSGWNKDTDGFGDVSAGNDFSVLNNGTQCSAQINVDHFSPAGDFTGTAIDEAFFANTLFQELDFSAATDSTFSLEIDFSVDSELASVDPSFIADYFVIGLNDGTGNYYDGAGELGFLYEPTDIDGAFNQVLTFELDNSFANQTGWFLDFQLNIGIDDFGFSDAFGSSFALNSAFLTEVENTTVSASAPATFGLLSLSLIGMFTQRKRRKN